MVASDVGGEPGAGVNGGERLVHLLQPNPDLNTLQVEAMARRQHGANVIEQLVLRVEGKILMKRQREQETLFQAVATKRLGTSNTYIYLTFNIKTYDYNIHANYKLRKLTWTPDQGITAVEIADNEESVY